MAAALQKEMNDSMTVLATTTLVVAARCSLDKGKRSFSRLLDRHALNWAYGVS